MVQGLDHPLAPLQSGPPIEEPRGGIDVSLSCTSLKFTECGTPPPPPYTHIHSPTHPPTHPVDLSKADWAKIVELCRTWCPDAIFATPA